jgi:hypothetical protein
MEADGRVRTPMANPSDTDKPDLFVRPSPWGRMPQQAPHRIGPLPRAAAQPQARPAPPS